MYVPGLTLAMLYLPSSEVAVPKLVPVMYTFAPTNGSLEPLSFTIPLTVIVWEEAIPKVINDKNRYFIKDWFFII